MLKLWGGNMMRLASTQPEGKYSSLTMVWFYIPTTFKKKKKKNPNATQLINAPLIKFTIHHNMDILSFAQILASWLVFFIM